MPKVGILVMPNPLKLNQQLTQKPDTICRAIAFKGASRKKVIDYFEAGLLNEVV